MTTWYGKSASKQIEALLESKPKLHQLLAMPEFTQELKSYNPKLLDYITNNSWLISEAVCYLTVAPQPQDSGERKYKLPLQVIEMIETETTCVLNGFFKEGEQKELLNFDLLFSLLDQQELLPLLAGYFFRTNLCLLNNRYKETVDRVYAKPRILHNLLRHSEHMAISNTVQLFLNLDINKSSASQPDRLALKLEVMRAIVRRVEAEHRARSASSAAVVENLCSVLIETVDKYYLIQDGKQMIEAITDQASVEAMMGLIRESSELAFPAFSFFISLINYYSFSSFNAEEQNSELSRKNTERMENQPMITELLAFFPQAVERIMACSRIDLYHYKLLEVLCHCISISSLKILRRICEAKFFGCLIALLFKHEHNNILHMLIEKSFYHVFISERKIYEDYKRHLFCELDIIDATVTRVLRLFKEDGFLEQAKAKPYFGHFMRILKIYSGIQPTDERIIAAIKAKTHTWNKISELLIKPYEAICFKELGSYENVPAAVYQEFTVKKESNMAPVAQNNLTLSEIEQEEHFPLATPALHEKKEDSGQHSYLFDCEPAHLSMKIDNLPLLAEEKDLKKAESFKEFISKKKVEAEQEIKVKRSLSQDKKLSSGSRGKMTSPSPAKKNSWKDDKEGKEGKEGKDKEEKTVDRSLSAKEAMPKVPINRRNIGPAANLAGERENRFAQEERRASRSVNMEEIRKIKVIQIDPPREKKYRKAEEKDRLFLDFLGISA